MHYFKNIKNRSTFFYKA